MKTDVKIYEQELYDELGQSVGKFALLVGGLNSENPMKVMNEVVSNYVEKELHNQFIDIRMDNPWCRLIISNIDQLKLVELTNDHKLKNKKIDIKEISDMIDLMGFKNVQVTDCTNFYWDGENVTKDSTKPQKIVSDFILSNISLGEFLNINKDKKIVLCPFKDGIIKDNRIRIYME